MAKRKITARKLAPPKPKPATPVFDQYNLQKNQEIRFHKAEGENWVKGIVKGESKDGSISLVADGQWRNIMPEFCQRKVEGPRGGTIWENL